MGLFSAIKSGLAKTRDALMGELKGIVGAGKITDETLEELEEHLIKADVGVEALAIAVAEGGDGRELLGVLEHVPLDFGVIRKLVRCEQPRPGADLAEGAL